MLYFCGVIIEIRYAMDNKTTISTAELLRFLDQKKAIEDRQFNEKYNAWLKAGSDFQLQVFYRNYDLQAQFEGISVDIIPLEGADNANLIFNDYRSRAFSLELHKLVLSLEGKVINRINFTY